MLCSPTPVSDRDSARCLGDGGLARLSQTMAVQVNVHEAKSQLSKLLARVEEGEEIVIARNGRPVATLTASRGRGEPHSGRGAWRDEVDMGRFDEADAEIARDFGA